MRLHSALLSSFVLLSLSTAACSVKLGDKTEGEKGAMTFAYDGPGCFFGCGLDRSALQGSLVTVTAKGGDAERRPDGSHRGVVNRAGVGAARRARATRAAATRASRTASSRAPSAHPARPSGAASRSTSRRTDQGDAHLGIVDPKGALVDRVTVRVRPAARIDVKVNGIAVEEGEVSTLRNGDKVGLESHAFGANGDEAIFTEHGISHDYGDTTILRRDDSVLFGSTNVEDITIDVEPGDTTVTVGAPGAGRMVRFHVVK